MRDGRVQRRTQRAFEQFERSLRVQVVRISVDQRAASFTRELERIAPPSAHVEEVAQRVLEVTSVYRDPHRGPQRNVRAIHSSPSPALPDPHSVRLITAKWTELRHF